MFIVRNSRYLIWLQQTDKTPHPFTSRESYLDYSVSDRSFMDIWIDSRTYTTRLLMKMGSVMFVSLFGVELL